MFVFIYLFFSFSLFPLDYIFKLDISETTFSWAEGLPETTSLSVQDRGKNYVHPTFPDSTGYVVVILVSDLTTAPYQIMWQ